MSDYSFSAGGSLKLKGGVTEGGIVKKKKKKSKSKGTNVDVELDREREQVKKVLSGEDEPRKSKSGSPSTSSRNSPGAGTNGTRKTEAEKRFEQVQKRRLAERVAKLANKTHKDRVSEFNAKLEALSEHHDIPKVGPG